MGKSLDSVAPARIRLGPTVIPTARISSLPVPPRKVEKFRPVASEVSWATKPSMPPDLFGPTTPGVVGKVPDLVQPATKGSLETVTSTAVARSEPELPR